MVNKRGLSVSLLFCGIVLLIQGAGLAADWPMWRYNANRGAVSPHELPPTLHLQWVREYPKLETAWNDQPRMRFDKAYQPVVMGKTLFVGSPHNDSVHALDTATGAERWRFYADGPVRFAPVAWRGKLYVCSDDGYLYCLDAANGTQLWKFRGGPSDRKVLGNRRLTSAWPIRGAPTLLDGKVYFAASIWPFMGIFIHALDAETGKVVWTNDRTGSMYGLRPHHSPAFSGLAPQGYLAAVGKHLLVPNGRTTIARLDRATGKLEYHYAPGGGNYHVAAAGRFYFNAGAMFEIETGKQVPVRSGRSVVMTDDMIYTSGTYGVWAYDVSAARVVDYVDRRGQKRIRIDEVGRLWRVGLPHPVHALIKAGARLYAGGLGQLTAIDTTGEGAPKISWQGKIEGATAALLAADSKLFAVTLDGRIYCFGAKRVTPRTHRFQPAKPVVRDQVGVIARLALKATGVEAGYCVVLGIRNARLAEELARQSKLHVIAIDPDARKVDAARKRLDALGLYGHRIVVLRGNPATYPLRPYLAELIVSEEPAAVLAAGETMIRQAFRVLRPYGGTLYLTGAAREQEAFAARVNGLKLPGAKVTIRNDGRVTLVRAGRLPGSGDWTHQNADVSNTVASKDRLVRAPLGLLWFGGPSNRKVLPRHGHGPSPQIVGGRLFIEGRDMLRAVDVYTGRVLWEADLPGLGVAYDNTAHQPGANAMGSNYVSLQDGVYVAYGRKCLRLDPATGRKMSEFTLPRAPVSRTDDPRWGSVAVYNDLLIAGADPIHMSDLFEENSVGRTAIGWSLDGSSSERIVVMDRNTGRVLWQVKATHGFIHNSIIAGGGKVFCIDRPRVPRGLIAEEERRETRPIPGSRILALDARTGQTVWSTTRNVFAAWLAYSERYDALLQAGRYSRDMVWDEVDNRMILYRGRTGEVLWDRDNRYNGPCMLLGDTILSQRQAYYLATGRRKLRRHPLTGQSVLWGYSRNYGCGSVVASPYLLTFRSAAAGYLDLASDSGTGNLGGFRSGCTSNLIVANGVLNAPDYTRTCTCGYPNQASLALVHMPEVESWTFNANLPWDGTPIRRIGINLGAPGDRRAENGTLWLEYPYVGGPTPTIPITTVPEEPRRFLKHSSRIKGAAPAWVAASGCGGLRKLTIPLARAPVMGFPAPFVILPLAERAYTVRLHFAEPEARKAGERVLRVKLQGRQVLKDFDIVKEAGGPDRAIVKEFRGIRAKDDLVIDLTASGAGKAAPVLCGVEVLAEGW